MYLDPKNPVSSLCAKGIALEGLAQHAEALALYQEAWEIASTSKEKMTAACHLARQQVALQDKLQWDETALHWAEQKDAREKHSNFPSLHHNIAKAREEMGELEPALMHYQLALSFSQFLPENSYANLLQAGIKKDIARLQQKLANLKH